jgi:hypothetical protein
MARTEANVIKRNKLFIINLCEYKETGQDKSVKKIKFCKKVQIVMDENEKTTTTKKPNPHQKKKVKKKKIKR